MTTRVTVTHEGPGHHDVLVQTYNKDSIQDTVAQYSRRLRNGESTSLQVYGGLYVKVSEIESLTENNGTSTQNV